MKLETFYKSSSSFEHNLYLTKAKASLSLISVSQITHNQLISYWKLKGVELVTLVLCVFD